MKAFVKFLAALSLTTGASSCSSFLDINTNPNQFTTESAPTPDAILAQALAVTAANYSGNNPSYNSYSMWAVDYVGRSGVVNGFQEEATYNYSSSYYQGLFNNTYDNLNDYNIIQQSAAGYPNHAAIARIMKTYNFLLLVDQYGDIPYTNALKGIANITPTYDRAQDIYRDLIVQLDGAISDIKNVPAGSRAVGPEDAVFGGVMNRWKQFAYSLKLRILLRESQTTDAALNTYVQQQMSSLQTAAAADGGFITADVGVNPGYAQNSGQQNPLYNRYGITFANANAGERNFQIPTSYIIAQYVNNSDPRVSVLYTVGRPTTYVGTNAGEAAPPSPTGSQPVLASRFLVSSATVNAGILKGFNAPTPLMLLSEHLFNKSEAETRGLFTGGETAAATDYYNGIYASFLYFYRPATTAAPTTLPNPASTTTTTAGTTQYNTYITTARAVNPTATIPGNPNVIYEAAATTPGLGRQYVILYQKYLAENVIAATEAWDDFRRAAQPKIAISVANLYGGRFPKRLLYPLSEVNTNQANVPTGVTQFTPIFWDVVD